MTTAIASALEEQGAATREISQNVQMAASGTQTLAARISTVNTAIGETSRSPDHVLHVPGKVWVAAATLTEQVAEFFKTLRSGRWIATSRTIRTTRARTAAPAAPGTAWRRDAPPARSADHRCTERGNHVRVDAVTICTQAPGPPAPSALRRNDFGQPRARECCGHRYVGKPSPLGVGLQGIRALAQVAAAAPI